MNDNYVEILVARKPITALRVLKGFCMVCCFLTAFLIFLTANALFVIVSALFGLGAFLSETYANVEYEYLYVDKELEIDKIFNKSKRKKAAKVNFERLEVMAPENSYHLDNYKNRTEKIEDYTSGDLDNTAYMIITDTQRILIEPNEEMIKLLKNTVPRKFFTD